MRYLSFSIENYRAINGPICIDIEKSRLIPIIGVNESGKTTILHAIHAFDYFNDKNNNGSHLVDIKNFYSTNYGSKVVKPFVSAKIQIELGEWAEAVKVVANEKPDLLPEERANNISDMMPTQNGRFELIRDLELLNYQIRPDVGLSLEEQNMISRQLIRSLPYILYFDDFRDKIEERIEIPLDNSKASDWLRYMERLFELTSPDASPFKLKDMDARDRKTLLSQVKDKFNATLTKEWAKFRLDDTQVLTVEFDYEENENASPTNYGYLKLIVVEHTANGARYFYISNRSKGFYWFFNFVTKLEFNDKVVDSINQSAIYLLDEPGSYLHSSAQSKLCEKLRSLSSENYVIYCTHSHYLLNPKVIPFKYIQIADKQRDGNIKLIPAHNHKGKLTRYGAFQPIVDALEMQDFDLDRNAPQILIVEGIYDYFAFQLFKNRDTLGILPATNADSMRHQISEMLLKCREFRVLWDNDAEGRKDHDRAILEFGEEINLKHFRLLKLESYPNKCILQNLFHGDDLVNIRQALGLSKTTSFEKTVATLFYTKDKDKVIENLSETTKANFTTVLSNVGFEEV